MKLVKCNRGHYYDQDKFASCPHCDNGMQPVSGDSVTVALSSAGSSDVTMAIAAPVGDDAVTVAQYAAPPQPAAPVSSEPVTQKSAYAEDELDVDYSGFQDVMSRAQNMNLTPAADDDNKTISYYSQKITAPVLKEPVVGWLVCTAGKYFGQSFQLKSGRNFIGRSAQMDVCLDGENSVSRDRHAVIIYEPKERMFIAQPGDSRELFYVNDEVVLDNVVLKPYDVISAGKVNLLMIPCCTKDFAWEDLEGAKAEEEKSDK